MKSSFWRGAILAAGACLPLLCGAAALRAQDASGPMQFWLQEELRSERHARPVRQPTRVRRLVPHAKLARPTIWRAPERVRERETITPETAPQATPPADGVAPAPVEASTPAALDAQKADASAPGAPPAAEAAGPAVSVLVVGDNLGYWLGQGLADAQNDAAPGTRLALTRKTKDSSGLVRDDFYDWQKALRDILKGPEKFGAIVVMIGSNDRQELRDAAGHYEPLTPRWRELYAARIDSFLALAKEKDIPVFWVGLPIMRAERYSSEIGQLNEIDRARVEAAGDKYIDIWDAFADENGRYSVFGPDVNGQIVKLRTSDGIHFTKAGARKLAYFLEQGMRPLLDRPATQPDSAIAALPPAGATAAPSGQPAPGAPPASAAPGAQPPPPAAVAPAAPPPPPKPLAGPIVPLTAPALAPGGELLGAAAPANAAGGAQARADVSRALAEGALPPAQPGRADDFSWPRR